MSLPVAKNAIHRAIEALYYRPLKKEEKDRIWKYFDSRCAYCDRVIDRKLRHGHMDHLECAANSGGNHIRNRVLACKECNGNEKRELNWEQFLKSKCPSRKVFATRRKRILLWQEQFPPLKPLILSAEGKLAKAELEEAIRGFQERFTTFREFVHAAKRNRHS